MKKIISIIVSLAVLSITYVLYGQASGGQRPAAPPATAVKTATPPSAAPVNGAAAQKLLDQYCVNCHNEDDKVANLTVEGLDTSHVSKDAQTWEKIIRKVRAGMMPPAGNPRPDRASIIAFTTWAENEIDKNAAPFTPSPGLHRLNRTEYANVVRDLLDLDIDPANYLPTDDSTHGFDNIAGALSLSPTLVEAYVTAAGKISRLAMGDATTP